MCVLLFLFGFLCVISFIFLYYDVSFHLGTQKYITFSSRRFCCISLSLFLCFPFPERVAEIRGAEVMEKAWKKLVSGGKEMFKGNGSGVRKPAPEPPWEPTGPDYTNNLPDEIMSTIFCYLTASDLGSRAARVCKRWWTIIGNNNPESDAFSPWRALVAHDFGSLAIEDRQEATWCECYRRWSTYDTPLLRFTCLLFYLF